jgi:hypothetical protein
MFATYFKWKVKAGREAEFLALWSKGTQALRLENSLGSALFAGEDGLYSGFARWPDKETRDQAFAKGIRPDIFDPLRDCIEETLIWDDLQLLENQWVT